MQDYYNDKNKTDIQERDLAGVTLVACDVQPFFYAVMEGREYDDDNFSTCFSFLVGGTWDALRGVIIVPRAFRHTRQSSLFYIQLSTKI